MAAENEYGQSKFASSQPVKVPEKMCDVVVLLRVTADREDQPESHCHNQIAS